MLRNVESARAAILELQGASLFDRKVILFEQHRVGKAGRLPDLQWGWVASQEPDPKQAYVRGPLTAPPADLFAPVREGRRIVFSNLPFIQSDPRKRREDDDALYAMLYRLLHNYNVTTVSYGFTYTVDWDTKSPATSLNMGKCIFTNCM